MSAEIRPLSDLRDVAACDIAYWLPPGGTDNGVWADMWELITDVDAHEVGIVLGLLAAVEVGAYAAIPGGRRARARGPVPHSIWVDATQYGRAEAVLIRFMQARARAWRCGRLVTD